MTIDEYRSKKNDKNSNYRNSLVKRTLTTFILVLIVLIVSKFSDNIKQFIKNNLLETNFQFSKINQIYQKYFGEILPDTVAVNSEVISNYNAIDYMDGAKLIVDENYNINLLESGIVVFIEAILSVITLILSTILLWTCLNGFKTLRVAKVSVVAKMCIAVFNVLFSPVLVFVGGNYYEKILSAQMLVYASALLINISYILFWFSITEENVATLTRRKNIHNEVVAETLHFCTNCGSKLTPSVYFCEQCGNQVRE